MQMDGLERHAGGGEALVRAGDGGGEIEDADNGRAERSGIAARQVKDVVGRGAALAIGRAAERNQGGALR